MTINDANDRGLSTERQQQRADHVVAMARRHAEEIRAAAEQEADRLLQESERKAAVLLQERLGAHQQELTRIAMQRDHVKNCLTIAESALGRIREATTVLSQIEPLESPGVPTVEESHQDDRDGRQHNVNRIVTIGSWMFGMWTVLMVAMYFFVSHQAASVDAATTRRADIAPVALTPQPTGTSSPPVSVSTPEPPKRAVADVAGLTVAFVASRDCWVSIAADDDMPRERLLKADERHVVQAREAVTFKAGNAAALTLVINDQPAKPLGSEGQVVTRHVTLANYRSFLSS